MSKYGIFCRKLLKYALRAEKMAASALRADSTLSPTLQRRQKLLCRQSVKQYDPAEDLQCSPPPLLCVHSLDFGVNKS